MFSPSTPVATESARETYTQALSCQAKFESCLKIPSLAKDDWAQNRLEDFNLWSMDIGATAARWQSSLDYRLKRRPDVSRIMVGLLADLDENIMGCLQNVPTNVDDVETEYIPIDNETDAAILGDQPEARSSTPDSDSLSQWSELSQDGYEHWGTLDQLKYYKQGVKLALAQLTRLSLVIRKAGAQFHHQRADLDFQCLENPYADLKHQLEFLLLRHQDGIIPYRQSLYQFLWSSSTLKTPLQWPIEAVTVIAKYIFDPSRLSSVQKRLIRANLKRRNRFVFARKHFPKSERSDNVATAQLQPKVAESQIRRESQVTEAPAKVETLQLKDIPPSKVTKSAVSATELGSQEVPLPTISPSLLSQISSTGKRINYPQPPHVDQGRDSFQCPYCYQTLPINYLKKNVWRKHVMQDVQPYSCIFDDCLKPDKLFETTKEWINHIEEAHSTYMWRCYTCPAEVQNFTSEGDFEHHLLTSLKHEGTFTTAQLPILIRAGRISVCKEITFCPLCNWSETHAKYTKIRQKHFNPDVYDRLHYNIYDHVNEHLHSFALMSLPSSDGPEEDSSHGSVISARSTIKWSDSEEDKSDDEPDEAGRQAFKALRSVLSLYILALGRLADNENLQHVWAKPWKQGIRFPYNPVITYCVNTWKRTPHGITPDRAEAYFSYATKLQDCLHTINAWSDEGLNQNQLFEYEDLSSRVTEVERYLSLEGLGPSQRTFGIWKRTLNTIRSRISVISTLSAWLGTKAMVDLYQRVFLQHSLQDSTPPKGIHWRNKGPLSSRWKRILNVLEFRYRLLICKKRFRNHLFCFVEKSDSQIMYGEYGNALQVAAFGLDANHVRHLLEDGADVNQQGGIFGSALQAASYWGPDQTIQILLDYGANTNVRGGFYGSALQAALMRGRRIAVQLLLTHGADVNIEGGFFGDPLEIAVKERHIELVQMLLVVGVSRSSHSLMCAIANGDHKIVLLLLEAGAKASSSALELAASEGHTDIVQILLMAGGTPSFLAFEAASRCGHKAIVKMLLQKGADGKSPFHYILKSASKYDNWTVLRTLLQVGASEFGHSLEIASKEGDKAIMQMLLEAGAQPSTIALERASEYGHVKAVQILLDAGAHPSSHALQVASENGYDNVIKLLLGAATSPEIYALDNALQVASENGHDNVVELLLGESTLPTNDALDNALQVASKNGHENVVELLLGAGTSPESYALDNALQVASENGHDNVVEMLLGATRSPERYSFYQPFQVTSKNRQENVIGATASSSILYRFPD